MESICPFTLKCTNTPFRVQRIQEGWCLLKSTLGYFLSLFFQWDTEFKPQLTNTRQISSGRPTCSVLTPCRFETQDTDKQLRCLFNVSKQTWPQVLPASPSPYILQSMAGLPLFGRLFPIQCRHFGYLPLLYLCPLAFAPVLFPSCHRASSVWSCPLRALTESDTAFALPHICHKLSPLPHLGAAMPFPSRFISFFSFSP